MKLAPFGHDIAAATAGQKESTAEDSLQLIEAFNLIVDPELRAEVVALAEERASHNPKFADALLKLKSKH